MSIKLGDWSNNERFDEEPTITIQSNRIAFNVEFVKRNNLSKCKYVYINRLMPKDNKSTQLAFLLSESADVVPGSKPFKLNRHPKVQRFQFTPKSWFDKNNLKSDQMQGTYTPIEEKDPRLGTLYVIEIVRK